MTGVSAHEARQAVDACRAALAKARTDRDLARAVVDDAVAQAVMNNATSAMVTSASWACPVCGQRGDLHEAKCFVKALADEARRLRIANKKVSRTNGELREREAASRALLEQTREALQQIAELCPHAPTQDRAIAALAALSLASVMAEYVQAKD